MTWEITIGGAKQAGTELHYSQTKAMQLRQLQMGMKDADMLTDG